MTAADGDDMAGGGQATESPPAQREETHTAVSVVQILVSGGLLKDGGAGVRRTFVAVARGTNAREVRPNLVEILTWLLYCSNVSQC